MVGAFVQPLLEKKKKERDVAARTKTSSRQTPNDRFYRVPQRNLFAHCSKMQRLQVPPKKNQTPPTFRDLVRNQAFGLFDGTIHSRSGPLALTERELHDYVAGRFLLGLWFGPDNDGFPTNL